MTESSIIYNTDTNITQLLPLSSDYIDVNDLWQRLSSLENCTNFAYYYDNAIASEGVYSSEHALIPILSRNTFEKCMKIYQAISHLANIQEVKMETTGSPQVPEFVGDCESATAELYNAYVCGFMIILCIVSIGHI